LLKGPTVFKEYYCDPEATTLAFTADGYLKTGDLVYEDDNHLLYLIGRKKELITLPNGEHISPAYIETKFKNLVEVENCMVYAKNNQLHCSVLPRLEKYTEQECYTAIQAINQRLPSFMRITSFSFKS
jgi:long-chain acyl-CoA synthetase